MTCQNGHGCSNDNGDLRSKLASQRKRTDKLAKMLCDLCALIEEHHPASSIQLSAAKVDGLDLWWHAHKEKDAAEKARKTEVARKKNLRRNALDKLTDEEKKELGL
jgi:hypothetical protein